ACSPRATRAAAPRRPTRTPRWLLDTPCVSSASFRSGAAAGNRPPALPRRPTSASGTDELGLPEGVGGVQVVDAHGTDELLGARGGRVVATRARDVGDLAVVAELVLVELALDRLARGLVPRVDRRQHRAREELRHALAYRERGLRVL